MKKDEMQAHQSQYLRQVTAGSAAEKRGRYREAIQHARASWPSIDGMMQFDRRYEERTHQTLDAIDVVLRCGPLLLDHRSLDAVAILLAECKRIERETGGYTRSLAAARQRLGEAYRLWSWLYENGNVMEHDLGRHVAVGQDAVQAIVGAWLSTGVVYRKATQGSHVIGLATRLGRVASAKCPTCGSVASKPENEFFQPLTCASCGSKNFFVILAAAN